MSNLSETSSCINLEPHDYKIVKRTTLTATPYPVEETIERVVCSKCGSIVDPFAPPQMVVKRV